MNKNVVIICLLFFSSFSSKSEELVEKEYCYFGAGTVYAHADNAMGFAAKFAFPMQKGFYFATQATFLPQMLGYRYQEYRYEIYFELYPIRIGGFQVFLQTGFDWGMWMRGYTLQYQAKMDRFKKDESLLFGGGICYNFKGLQVFADFKYYPSIFNAHSTIGIKYKVFENRNMRHAYYRYLRRKMDISPAEK